MDAVAIVFITVGSLCWLGSLYFSLAIAKITITLKFLWAFLSLLILTYIAGCFGYIYFTDDAIVSSEVFSVLLVYFAGSASVLIATYFCLTTIKSMQKLMSVYSENKALNYLANHDYLTKLYNRFYLINELDKLITQVKRGGPESALLFIDLDGFKGINDTFGHLAGDYILKKIALIFQARSRETDIVARYGGDEFIIMLYNVNFKKAREFAQNICDEMAGTVHRYQDHEITLHCCIGISLITGTSTSVGSIISDADKAVYAAKKKGYNQIVSVNVQ